jgi:adenylate kinase family enzyme
MNHLKLNSNKPKRINIVGCSGSGKSTLARYLSKKFDLPVHHIDKISWKSGWVQLSENDLKAALKPIADSDKWILDGTYDYTFDISLPKTDLLILIGTNRYTCLFRVIRRAMIFNKKKPRPDMADGCFESINFEFYNYIWNYNKLIKPRICS